MPDHSILQWRGGKGRKTRLVRIAWEPASFPFRGGSSFRNTAEVSGERKEEGFEQPTARTRRERGWSFEQVSRHVPRVGQRRCLPPDSIRRPTPTSNDVNCRSSSNRFQNFEFCILTILSTVSHPSFRLLCINEAKSKDKTYI